MRTKGRQKSMTLVQSRTVSNWMDRKILFQDVKLSFRDPFLIRGVITLSLSTVKKIGQGNDLVITQSFHKILHAE